MRTYVLMLALVLSLRLGSPTGLPAAPLRSTKSDQIAQLIAQLGSTKYQERETATQALDAIGPPALGALQQATRNSDLEIRRRAESLAQQIRKRVESAQLLEPKRIHLTFDETPVPRAITDLRTKTGFSIQLSGLESRLANRKITLDTGETTFWEAFDQFCQKAGLVERTPPVRGEQNVRVWDAKGVPVQGAMVIAQPYHSPAVEPDGRLTLSNGAPRPVPTYYAGAVRIRALPANGRAPNASSGETCVVIEATPEPLLAWQGMLDLCIDKAVDEHGQNLTPVSHSGNDGAGNAYHLGNGVVVWDMDRGQLVNNNQREMLVRLKLGDQPSKTLKELTGTVAAHVQTPLQTLITVENILQSAGQTFKEPAGESLQVLEAAQQENGSVKLRLRMEQPLQAFGPWAMNGRGAIVRANGLVRRQVLRDPLMSDDLQHLELKDGDGRNYYMFSRDLDAVAPNQNGLVREVQIVFRPRPGQGKPARLVYSGRRVATVEVPFTLKEVPLP
jgi:hypothetical protein